MAVDEITPIAVPPDDNTTAIAPDRRPQPRTVYVLGGGLAGMAAAFELSSTADAESGSLKIEVVEAEDVLGGKAKSFRAGADHPGNYFATPDLPTDKGYHVFPYWYWDLWALLGEAGLISEGDHADCSHGDGCCDATSPFTCPTSPASRDYTLIRVLPDARTKVTDTSFSPGEVLAAGPALLAHLRGFRRPAAREAARRTISSAWATVGKLKQILVIVLVMVGLAGASSDRLRRRSLEDHLSGRWYAGDSILERVSEIVLKALANPSYDASATTTANTFRRWLPVYLQANWRACRGPLNETLVEPLRDVLVARGVVFTTGRRVATLEFDADRLARFHLATDDGKDTTEPVELTDDDGAIIALPHTAFSQEGMVEWANQTATEDAIRARRAIQQTGYIETAAMASLDLYFAEPPTLEDGSPLPAAHFSLVDSPYATTGFVASDQWNDEARALLPAGATTLVQFVCSDVVSLRGMSPAEATRAVIDDIRRFIPSIGPLASPGAEHRPHTGTGPGVIVDALLSMNDRPADQVTRNDAGTWDRRPGAEVGLSNAWLAGDYCLCPVDVASMEAAMSTGVAAARAAVATVGVAADEPNAGSEPANLPFGGVVPPLKGEPPRKVRWVTRLIQTLGIVGGTLSFLAGTALQVLVAPYTLTRRQMTQNLRGAPRRRRKRDLVTMAAGPLALPVVAICIGWMWSTDGTADWRMNPWDPDFASSRARWFLVGTILYLLLMVFAVAVRRFLFRSRGASRGVLIAAIAYLFTPLVALGPDDTAIADRLPVAGLSLLTVVGLVWSAHSAYRELEGEQQPLSTVRTWARPWTIAGWLATAALVVHLGVFVSNGGGASIPTGLIALAVGHGWLAALGVYLFRVDEAATVLPGTGSPDTPRTNAPPTEASGYPSGRTPPPDQRPIEEKVSA